MKCLKDIICDAKCCAVEYAAGFIDSLTFGRSNDSRYDDYMTLMMYIDVLERNQQEYVYVKELVAMTPKKIHFSSLKKENNTLHLDVKEEVVCREIKIEPCLPDSDIEKIVEQIKRFCSTCGCNCN